MAGFNTFVCLWRGLTENQLIDVSVAVMAKEYKGAKYLFAVGMRDGKTNASFTVLALKGKRIIEVLGENRTILSQDGIFNDTFDAWGVHLYRVGDKNTN